MIKYLQKQGGKKVTGEEPLITILWLEIGEPELTFRLSFLSKCFVMCVLDLYTHFLFERNYIQLTTGWCLGVERVLMFVPNLNGSLWPKDVVVLLEG